MLTPWLQPADLTESISGSEASTASDAEASTSSSSESNNGGANLTRLLRKQHLASSSSPHANQDDEGEDLDVLTAGPRTALQWFETPRVPPPDTQYGVHRAALPRAGARKRPLPGQEEGQAVLQELKELQLQPEPQAGEGGDKERKWTLLMFGGGHFAGMVVSLRPKLVKSSKKGSKEKEREVVVLHKKTFHRYTSTSPRATSARLPCRSVQRPPRCVTSDRGRTPLAQLDESREARKAPTTRRTGKPNRPEPKSVATTKPCSTMYASCTFASFHTLCPVLLQANTDCPVARYTSVQM